MELGVWRGKIGRLVWARGYAACEARKFVRKNVNLPPKFVGKNVNLSLKFVQKNVILLP